MWTDESVYDLLGLTQDERAAVDELIPDYYGRKKSSVKFDSGADVPLVYDDDSEAV